MRPKKVNLVELGGNNSHIWELLFAANGLHVPYKESTS